MRLFLIILTFLVNNIVFGQAITIGTLNYDPPFGMAADQQGHFYGFEIDLMMTICKNAKLECQFKGMDFTDLFTELLARRIDLSLGAISITQDRRQNFLFSLPYLESSGQFMAKKSSSMTNLDSIRSQRVGIESGTLFKSFIQQRFGNQVSVTEFKNQQDLLNALGDDKVDLVLVDTGTAQYWVVNNSRTFKTVGPKFTVGTGYGIMANTNQTLLINRINNALLQIQNDGTYLKLYNRYFSNMKL